jgi:hypothetical protein
MIHSKTKSHRSLFITRCGMCEIVKQTPNFEKSFVSYFTTRREDVVIFHLGQDSSCVFFRVYWHLNNTRRKTNDIYVASCGGFNSLRGTWGFDYCPSDVSLWNGSDSEYSICSLRDESPHYLQHTDFVSTHTATWSTPCRLHSLRSERCYCRWPSRVNRLYRTGQVETGLIQQ